MTIHPFKIYKNPINKGIEEQLQNGVTVPSNALRILALIP